MSQATAMLETFPADMGGVDKRALASAIDACMECSQACTACADACLSEDMVAELKKCIRTNLDCADICEITARMLSRHTEYDANMTRAQLQACIQACTSCADECSKHSQHEHCNVCAQASRRCQQACENLIKSLG